MESAAIKLFNPVLLNRHLHSSFPKLRPAFTLTHPLKPCHHQSPHIRRQLSFNPNVIQPFSRFHSSIPSSFPHPNPHLNPNPLSFLLSLSIPKSQNATGQYEALKSENKDDEGVFTWSRAVEEQVGFGYGRDKTRKAATVVLLGWLGAETKHLRRYAELYNSKGIHAVNFVVPVTQVLRYDLGRRVERRITQLANELECWVAGAEEEEDDKNGDRNGRCLIFHTFSNTGWLVYGSILERWKEKPKLIEKIKGCVVDSGGDPQLNPQVWAAGFCAAILKKRSSLTKSSTHGSGVYELGDESHMPEMQRNAYDLLEVIVLMILEKLFSILLNLPDVNKRLTKIISRLSEKPAPCPQLYLYSTADKVIPYDSVEYFIEVQRGKGIDISSFNFQSSPHVDHFRTFPDLYTSVLHKYLEKCLSQTK